ncbi:MAG: O-antigen ligase family protein [bacterium]|nr:O-antigen ligase family protein [bacterium]
MFIYWFKSKSIILLLAILLSLVVLCYQYNKTYKIILNMKIYYIFYFGILLSFIYAFHTNRWQQAIQTFVERIIQVDDGIRALRHNIFFGVGPGNWYYVKHYWQTAEYNAVYIHSSYVQIAVETGIIPLIFIFLIITPYLKNIYKLDYMNVIVPIVILFHGLLDITLLFLSIDFVLILLLLRNVQCNKYLNIDTLNAKFTMLIIAVGLFMILRIQSESNILQKQFINGNYEYVISKLENDDLIFKISNKNKLLYIKSLYESGYLEKAKLELDKNFVNWPDMIILKAKLYEELGQDKEALRILIKGLENAPFETKIYDYINYIIENKLNEDLLREMYKKEMQKNIEKLTYKKNFLTKYLNNQKYIKN